MTEAQPGRVAQACSNDCDELPPRTVQRQDGRGPGIDWRGPEKGMEGTQGRDGRGPRETKLEMSPTL